MTIRVPRGKADKTIKSLMVGFRKYQADHPNSKIELYRQNAVSIRVRIIDPDFEEFSRFERHQTIWEYLKGVPEDDQNDISMLLLLTPDEVPHSAGSLEFDEPAPSLL